MPTEPLHAAFEALRARLQAELDAQLASFESTIDARHREALAEVVRANAAAAGHDGPPQLEAGTAESARGGAAGAASHDPQQMAAVPGVAVQVEPRDGPRAALTRLNAALRRISHASSLTAALDALAAAAAAEAPRTALFLITAGDDAASDHQLDLWRSAGFEGRDDTPGAGPLGDARRTRQPAPDANRAGLVVPIVVGGEAVALLHAQGEPVAAWSDTVTILARHASACLSVLTSTRVSQALSAGTPAAPSREDEGSARRYARLLVSEIKLYHESAVRTGRERRDLLSRLRPEIDRARRLYEDRVPVTIGNRATLFHQELVQTLAEGDPSLLGASA